MRHTHSDRLERWLGAEQVADISRSMRDWYGPPIAIRGVPGAVYAARGGDFVGPIAAGAHQGFLDFAESRGRRILRNWSRRQAYTAGAGFSSIGDLISEATTGGKRRARMYNKAGTTGVVAGTNSLWRVGNQPAAGAAAAAAPGGTVPTGATTGALNFGNPGSGDTQHLTRWEGGASVASNTLLLYDRIFAVAKTMNSTATEAVTGVPTRYQSTTAGAQDSAAGNFLFMECGTALAATSHNWTVCTYTDEGGNASTLPSVTGNLSNIINRLDMPVGTWFAPLEANDVGIQTLTQMQCSAAVATGAIDFVIGHPLAFLPSIIANKWEVLGMIADSFGFERVFDDACLALLEVTKPATTATTYTGMISTVSG